MDNVQNNKESKDKYGGNYGVANPFPLNAAAFQQFIDKLKIAAIAGRPSGVGTLLRASRARSAVPGVAKARPGLPSTAGDRVRLRDISGQTPPRGAPIASSSTMLDHNHEEASNADERSRVSSLRRFLSGGRVHLRGVRLTHNHR